MILDPLATSDAIVSTYRRYLRTLVEPKDPRLATALDAAIGEAINQEITKGPLLEATPPYATGATPRQLIDEGVLEPGFATLGDGAGRGPASVRPPGAGDPEGGRGPQHRGRHRHRVRARPRASSCRSWPS